MAEKEKSESAVQFVEEWNPRDGGREDPVKQVFHCVWLSPPQLFRTASIEASGQDEEKAKNLLSYLVNMRLKMKEDLTAVDGTKFTLDLSVKENLLYI